MRKALSIITGLWLLSTAAHTGRAVETTWEYSVQVSATVQSSPARITLSWPQDVNQQPGGYTIYRKGPGETSWGSGTTLPGSATTFTDDNVAVGVPYEYQVVKNSSLYTGYGYVYAGIQVPLTENRGKLLLVVDRTYATELAAELSRLQRDLVGDGWTVTRLEVNRNDSPANVKQLIQAEYNADPGNVKSVFLFGHVPVPYSGDIVPDGHAPEHQGAWPCDGYYGDMDGAWTDSAVNNSGAEDARNRNVPGDGKFDPSTFPVPLKLMVGRVDLANMPGRLTWGGPATFPSELELLRNYLNKDHLFRTGRLDLPRRALVGDYFGARDGEAFAAGAWRNFAPMFGAENITSLPGQGTWIPTLSTQPYLWAYGCGAGTRASIGGLGTTQPYNTGFTADLLRNDVKAAFTLLFGSWLGDWDSEDNIMRSVLALPTYGLTCGWSGRPHWFLHHMALGEPIGFGARLTQNNGRGGLYQNQVNTAAGMIHVALMGDPTLRLHVVKPPGGLAASVSGSEASLSWTASSDSVIGYHVYGSPHPGGPYTRLTSTPVADPSFTGPIPSGVSHFMVRAVKLESSSSGTYFNLSQGVFATASGGGAPPTPPVGGGSPGTGGNPGGATSGTNAVPPGGATNSPSATNSSSDSVVWVEDALPAGAVPGTDGNDAWTWIRENPAPFSGSAANQSWLGSGLHQHFFTSATQTLRVGQGDVLFAYVYVDPVYVPRELMLQWNDGNWEHRAFWGEDLIDYGTNGTPGRVYMGPLPEAGKWVRLEVPAARVGLGGRAVSGMAFSLYDGKANWDCAGKSPAATSGRAPEPRIKSPPPSRDTNAPPTSQPTQGIPANAPANAVPPGKGAPGTPATNSASNPGPGASPSAFTNALPGASVVDGITPAMAKVGDTALHVLSPNLLELVLVNTKQPDPARVTAWDLVDNNNQFVAPPANAFQVTADGRAIAVTAVGFKRRPLYAPLAGYDLRIGNYLYLVLAGPISDHQAIEVRNPDGSLWPAATQFKAAVDPLRYSPAIHVNQEGYMPSHPKKAMVGYYAGSLGELNIPDSAGFKLVDANTGAPVHQGALLQRPDVGYTHTPAPYQKVYEADFTAFNTPGLYRLVVPGLGASLPFSINEGVAMAFTRAYALGLYHQRCGTSTTLPHTRFTHDVCHHAPASVPDSAEIHAFTWKTIADSANTLNGNNPPQTAPALTSPNAQLFPYVNRGPVDVAGGHHDAGDYSKYTANSANLIHYLMFAVDSLPGVAALDNLGLPESGDGISDLMQEAKWEADFLAKMQDSDGGFYFLVYPRDRRYESDVTPDKGDPQVVWPKTTAATAASVAALAQCASSPAFQQAYPEAAARYLEKAKLGWQFLLNAVNRYGKNGAYQKITHYGDDFTDSDELAWAACEMYLATGDPAIHQKLLSWFDPADPATWRWGWWHMCQCYGHAIRSYAFAARSGRIAANQLDQGFLGKCQTEIAAAADDMLKFSQQNAYGTSFPSPTKAVQSAGWYFSTDQAFDLVVAHQLNPQSAYLDAMIANLNYEGGCNPVNVSFVTGLGWKRQREIVHQWSLNDERVMPLSGIPVGNIHAAFFYSWNFGTELNRLCFPADGAGSVYPYYDRWADNWNVSTEFVILNSARSIGTLGFLAAQTPLKNQAWKAPQATVQLPSSGSVGAPVTASLQVPGMDLGGARITWEARDQEPAFGPTFTFAPKNGGEQWVEAEAQWPDGRRAFARATFQVN